MVKLINRFLIFAVVFLAGCALSPQEIDVSPRVAVEKVDRNFSGVIRVKVIDQRSSSVIGYRGGVYSDTNPIETSADFPLSIQSALELAIRQMGLTVTDSADAPELRLVIEELTYKVPDSSYITHVELNAVAKAEVVGAVQQFDGQYRSNLVETLLKAPSEQQNVELVNKVLADLLGKIFADKNFKSFITTQVM